MESLATEAEMEEAISDLANLPTEPPTKREICSECCRPKSVCWCPYLPEVQIPIKDTLYILQHPSEEKRSLRTAKILELSLPKGKCKVIRGKRFNKKIFDINSMNGMVRNPVKNLLIYPGSDSVPLSSISPSDEYNLFLLDGTWSEARSIYRYSSDVQSFTKVSIDIGKPSNYVIRTQPTESSLSTVEAAAIGLSHLNPDCVQLYNQLTRPLRALCSFQLDHGAVHHYSKEYLILNGLYTKQITKKIEKRLGKQEDFKNLIR